MTLRDQILKAAALPDIAIIAGADHLLICQGEEQENARLTPLLSALADCVGALERSMAFNQNVHAMWRDNVNPMKGDRNLLAQSYEQTKDALARLREVVK